MNGLLSCDTFSLDFSKILSDNEQLVILIEVCEDNIYSIKFIFY